MHSRLEAHPGNFGLSKLSTVSGRILSAFLLFWAPLSFGDTKLKEFYANRSHIFQVDLLRKVLPRAEKIQLAKQRAYDLSRGALVGLESNTLKSRVLEMVPNALNNLKKYPQMLKEDDLIKIGDEASCKKNTGAYFDFRYRYVYLCPELLDDESIDAIAGTIVHELTHRIQQRSGSHIQREREATQMQIILFQENDLSPLAASYLDKVAYGVQPHMLWNLTYSYKYGSSIFNLKPGMTVRFKPALIKVSRMHSEGHFVYSGNDGWEFSVRAFPRGTDLTEYSESTTHEISEVSVDYSNGSTLSSVVLNFADGPVESINVIIPPDIDLPASAVEAMLYETLEFNLPTP